LKEFEMKKVLSIGVVLFVALAVLGVAGIAYAQSQTPPDPDAPFYGPGMMRRNGGFGAGMMGRWGDGGFGPMHTGMVEAFAEALGLSPEEIETRLDAGESMYAIAQSQGLSNEEFFSLMVDARTKALEQAVADGVLTQEQADWMLERMNQRQATGYGPGNCPMQGGSFGQRGGPGRRWSNP
jgi:hypothetical protein